MTETPTQQQQQRTDPPLTAAHIRDLQRSMVCSHMVLTRVRQGSPVLFCGSCPTLFIMSKMGSYIAIRADEADLMAQDLIGMKRAAEISKGAAAELWTPARG